MTHDSECTDVREEFSALLDGELSPEQQERVEAHLAQCADCLRELDGLKRIDTLYRDLPGVPAPEDFEVRLRKAIRPNIIRFPRLSLRNRPLITALASAAALVLVVGASFMVLRTPELGRFDVAGITAEEQDSSMDLSVQAPPTEAQAAAPLAEEPMRFRSAAKRAGDDVSEAGEAVAFEDAAAPPASPESAELDSALGELRAARPNSKNKLVQLLSSAPAGPDDKPDFGDTFETKEVPAAVAEVSARYESAAANEFVMKDERAAVKVRSAPAPPPPPAKPKPERAVARAQPDLDQDGASKSLVVLEESPGVSEEFVAPSENSAPLRTAPETAPLGKRMEVRVENQYEPNEVAVDAVGVRMNKIAAGKSVFVVEKGAQQRQVSRLQQIPRRSRAGDVKTEEAPARSFESREGLLLNRAAQNVEGAQVAGARIVPPTKTRSFELRDGVWYETDYAGQSLTELARDSRKLKRLIKNYPGIGEVLPWNARIVFQIEGKWYAIKAPEAPDERQ